MRYSSGQIKDILKNAPKGSQYYTDGYDVKYRKVIGDKYFGYLDEAKGWVETCDKQLSQERIDKGLWLTNLIKERESQMNIDNLATQTPEEKEALDLIDITPHQYEMSKFSGEPRTKVEYVKCEYGDKASNIVMDFENNAPLYKVVNDEYWTIDELDDLFAIILDGGEHIYRRIETPMTEREAFINEACNVNEIAHGERRQYLVESLFDSGKFKLVESN